jgi:hypothetical protein
VGIKVDGSMVGSIIGGMIIMGAVAGLKSMAFLIGI